jgi:hypothetical protein
MQQWIKDAHFEQIKKIVVGILVLIIERIDMSKQVVNGVMVIVKFTKFNDVKTY